MNRALEVHLMDKEYCKKFIKFYKKHNFVRMHKRARAFIHKLLKAGKIRQSEVSSEVVNLTKILLNLGAQAALKKDAIEKHLFNSDSVRHSYVMRGASPAVKKAFKQLQNVDFAEFMGGIS